MECMNSGLSLQAAEVPLQDVPANIAELASGFIAQKGSAPLSRFAEKVISAIFEDIPESASNKVVPPKAKVCHLHTIRVVYCSDGSSN